MPELPEVETVRRGLNQLTLHREITGGDVLLDRTIAYPLSVDKFTPKIIGSAIASWHRRGKYLLAELTPSPQTHWLGVHLRMTGQLLWVNQNEPLHKHTRVRLFFGEEQELRFVDQRTFGQMWWVPPGVAVETIMTGLAKLAVDPFSPEFTVEYLASKLQNRRRPIKTALLDQSVVAGLGNIYADEALFKSGILPVTLCSDLQSQQIEPLRTAIIEVLSASIAAGGTTFSNFLNVKGVNGNYGGEAWVYNRAGEPCKVCGTPIQRIKLAGRSSHFCSQCQN
ncbi:MULTISPECIES: DNA-formamidopyrimidine glycosylase [Cyanophyceae]|uniref:DNA-formamidopyrimidine glycosylase n=1 Tax=Cyanophyceae TaxID=3028117 RepID=UPI00232D8AE0|nr:MULTISPECIES: DNA-formamidopyrimidine glycosylase [Cyanophyceae]MDB9358091.1 DNA-formamidopyrimidine glycosylase [Nodularia spumigena CS-587/03]MDB9306641.1 DNA-formamidopyrimidine glycosylase [Nodularia spumigena CS-591/12]MDB9316122.1 DNA-formamidopyrimidine glycosylase [Nodularia spumigena CS-590/01A]MDB9321938.1 DNA-formamidopyrimidine glycosylase [Nodularia spumigena CS-591/07A]MDB9327814.1 DNA-formamidopyrimidine glycosylase [Nodularia spumigena CS-590/02]